MGRKGKGKGEGEARPTPGEGWSRAALLDKLGVEPGTDVAFYPLSAVDEVATAPTVACNEFVPRSDFDATHCARCGGTHESMAPADVERRVKEKAARVRALLDDPELIAEIAEQLALRSEQKRAKDDGPVYLDPTPGSTNKLVRVGVDIEAVIDIKQPWWARALVMAGEKGLSPSLYLEGLVRAAWVARPLRKRGE